MHGVLTWSTSFLLYHLTTQLAVHYPEKRKIEQKRAKGGAIRKCCQPDIKIYDSNKKTNSKVNKSTLSAIFCRKLLNQISLRGKVPHILQITIVRVRTKIGISPTGWYRQNSIDFWKLWIQNTSTRILGSQQDTNA